MLVGQSPQIATVRRLIQKAGRNRLPVLLLGESGTGKEVVARLIYESHKEGAFVPIDCGSLVGTLMESDLFGHVRGAFSGAAGDKKGLVEIADGGTAFFDEIGDLPLEMQVKLLRLLQESEFRPVGGLQWRRVNIRVIAATHRDLRAEVAGGRFRLDLYYRLNVFSMRLPPLRDRKSDIPLLVNHFLEEGRAKGLPPMEITGEMHDLFQAYDWPGNVRELKNCIDRLCSLHSEGPLQMIHLPSALQRQTSEADIRNLSGALDTPSPSPIPSYTPPSPIPVMSLPQSERDAISRALAATGGERQKTARLLRTSRTTLYRKMKQYGMR
jgi:DNA-binding NtrC family response regulator